LQQELNGAKRPVNGEVSDLDQQALFFAGNYKATIVNIM